MDQACHFWYPGSLNGINTIDSSPPIAVILAGTFPPRFPHTIDGKSRSLLYYLADGIYPNWSVFVKAIKEPVHAHERAFSSERESVREYVERAFEVLMSRWQIMERLSRLEYREDMANIVMACICIHNMIVEARPDGYCSRLYDLVRSQEGRRMVNGKTVS